MKTQNIGDDSLNWLLVEEKNKQNYFTNMTSPLSSYSNNQSLSSINTFQPLKSTEKNNVLLIPLDSDICKPILNCKNYSNENNNCESTRSSISPNETTSINNNNDFLIPLKQKRRRKPDG